MINLCQNDSNKIYYIFNKIIKLIESILSSKNNIEDAINSKFFEIFSIFIDKLKKYNEKILSLVFELINKLMKNKYHPNEIFSSLKELLLKFLYLI